ncbi:hypothetical protein [Ferrimonas lipolytica]|uniref:Uncharacterized protein n=1 Tax=Ferrimonas lipolytica TaxID=2724191 RepID=A0A6H1UGH4_9GAMM|nr:hypothetical protein [Ferrimonas lipolytica]QIZ77729.1 hypothetical protein HER31_12975 [Ferrimonas lipolytica]
MKRTSLALLTAVALTPAAQAAFVPITCVIDQPGQINALINTDGKITAVTKLKRDPTKEIYPIRYRNDESSQERYGAATATFTVNMQADNCGFDSNYVVTLKSTNDSKPWQQF